MCRVMLPCHVLRPNNSMMANIDDRSVPTLEEFGISPTVGFFIENPLGQLPEYYQPWEELCGNLPDLLRQHELQDKVNKMSVLDWKQLKSRREIALGHLLVSSLAAGYVWQDGIEGAVKVLPKCLAEPLRGLSDSLGIPPVPCYATFMYANIRPKDANRQMDIENMENIVNLTSGSVSAFEWFLRVTGQVELCGVPGIKGILSGQHSVRKDDVTGMIVSLRQVKESLEEAKKAMHLFHEGLEASEFYRCISPFMRGWSDLPQPITFEGVISPSGKMIGLSAAHTPMLPTFDAGLGISFTAERAEFVKVFRSYMFPEHRRFIESVRQGPSIKEYVEKKTDPSLKQLYIDCINVLADIRTTHVALVTKYVVTQTHKYEMASQEAREGVTKVLSVMKSIRDECRSSHEEA